MSFALSVCAICGSSIMTDAARALGYPPPAPPGWCADCAGCPALVELSQWDAACRSGGDAKIGPKETDQIYADFVIPAFSLARILRYTARSGSR